ncbi:MAG TPA: ribonuclease III domain-containing protein [Bacteroidales bacterium]|nr:ribonuclease III domain-containing protein [Bacteroidales bacterium]HQB75173.1 ribonuclease III domain-containing protein [Bacteroidales bacterium]HQQ20671.1 ribonuclease III domain-containing protein [Bacteroidales bacterium]
MLFKRLRHRKESASQSIEDYLRHIIGIKTRNLEIYRVALTHRSASKESNLAKYINNERLEYLGDAVLNSIISEYLFKKYPLVNEGALTEMRSKLVCRERLNMLARKIGLCTYISAQSGVKAKSIDGDAFEALVGAIYLDKGYKMTQEIVLKRLFLLHLDVESVIQEDTNYKGKLYNWGNKNNREIRFENQLNYEGDERKLHKSEVFIDGVLFGEALHYTIKKAEQMAASRALETISEQEYES